MNMVGQCVSLCFTRSVRRWRFPPLLFTTFDAADAELALRQGWSVWGGEEYAAQETIRIPRALITAVTEDGVKFTAMPDNMEIPT